MTVPPSLSHLKLPIFLIWLLLLALGQLQGVQAVKFKLQAERCPQPKCLWNSAHDNALVIVTANVGSGTSSFTFRIFFITLVVLTKYPLLLSLPSFVACFNPYDGTDARTHDQITYPINEYL